MTYQQKLSQACEAATREICENRIVDPSKAMLVKTVLFSESEIADVIYKHIREFLHSEDAPQSSSTHLDK